MGADLLLIAMVVKDGTRLNWPAGREVIKKMDIAELATALVECDGEEPERANDCRRRANEILTELKRELKDSRARDTYIWKIGDRTVHIRGGTSWGDDPSDGYRTFSNAHSFPAALEAIGFDLT